MISYKHLAIYSIEAHEVVAEKKIKASAKVKDEVKIAEGDEHIADLPLFDYDLARYHDDVRGRGGDWAVYSGDAPFSWDKVIPKEGE